MKKQIKNKVVSISVLAIMSVSLINCAEKPLIVQANENDKTITGLGTGAISNPIDGDTEGLTTWTGSYIYYGTYDYDGEGANAAEPIKYRVLDKDTTDFSVGDIEEEKVHTMLLDCDSVLFQQKFRVDWQAEDSKKWAMCDIKKSLADENDNESFINTSFTPVEKEVISLSTKGSPITIGDKKDGDGSNNLNYAELENDTVFLLDAKEVTRRSYGYTSSPERSDIRKKKSKNVNVDKTGYGIARWWLRSPQKSDLLCAIGSSGVQGDVLNYSISYNELGVSPAFNLKLSSIIFSSPIQGEDNSYKLTLMDDDLKIELQSEKKAVMHGSIVTIPYNLTNDITNNIYATQVSVLITDKEYNEIGAQVLDYKKLDVESFDSLTNEGFYKLPESLKNKTIGTDYHFYILAEKVNVDNKDTTNINESFFTDYASEPLELTFYNHNSFTKHSAVAASCETSGNLTYWTCDDCNKVFKDATGNEEFASVNDTIIVSTGHISMLAVKENEIKSTCTTNGSYDEVIYCSVCNAQLSRVKKISTKLDHTWDNGKIIKEATPDEKGIKIYTCLTCESTKTEEIEKLSDDTKEDSDLDEPKKNTTTYVSMYRLYNPNSGEHFYTANAGERDNLVKVGWRYEGIAWNAPETSDTPVYRLYNPNAGDHHYTTSAAEKDNLVNVGWKYEGIGWYSTATDGQPLYRLYNPNAKAGSHHYTTSAAERDNLKNLGWRDEGIAWYGGK